MQDEAPATVEDLLALRAGMRLNKAGDMLRRQRWHVCVGEMPFDDFNREVIPPGTDRRFPLGAVGIRMDGDFWTAAVLPHRFAALGCREIVGALWPDVEDPTFLPDSGDPWWSARADDAREVPGAPFEVWGVVTDPTGDVERTRSGCHPDLGSALAAERGERWRMHVGWTVAVEILAWSDGRRSEVLRMAPSDIEFVDAASPGDA